MRCFLIIPDGRLGTGTKLGLSYENFYIFMEKVYKIFDI